MKKVAYLFLVFILVLSSCSSKKYGHYRYSKKKTTTAKVKTSEKRKKLSMVQLNTIENSILSSEKEAVSINDSASYLINIPNKKRPNRVLFNDKEINKGALNGYKENHLVNKSPIDVTKGKVPNKMANTAFYLSMGALFFGLVGFLAVPFLLIFGVVLGIAAFVFAIKALNQMAKRPEKYSNTGKAVIALIIGITYMVLILIGLIALGLLFLYLFSL